MRKTFGEYEVRLAMDQYQIPTGDEVRLQTVAKNIGDGSAVFCVYHTPFEGIANEIFEVKYGEDELPYLGPLKSRIPPQDEHYITLQAGEEKSHWVRIIFEYDLKAKGTYTIKFKGAGGLPESNRLEFEII